MAVKNTRVRRRVTTRCTTNRTLVDGDNFIKVFDTFDSITGRPATLRPVELN